MLRLMMVHVSIEKFVDVNVILDIQWFILVLLLQCPEQQCIQYGGTNTECILIDCEESPYEPFPPSYELGGIWRHNDRCDLYTNYYDEQYGWEIEFVESQGQVVNTLRNIEYEMEAWLYKTPEDADGNPLEGYSSCENKYHELDYNFNKAIIYNTEQVSGLLNLNLAQKNNAWFNNLFPNASPISI